MQRKIVQLSLFGACEVHSVEPGAFEIKGGKHKALFALLVTAPLGRRTRSFIQDVLWGRSCFDNGRQSLRRALSDIKRIMGDSFSEVFAVTNSEIKIDLARVEFVGRPGAGEFLEGMDLREDGFDRWLVNLRTNPEQIYSLYSTPGQPVTRPIVPTIAVLPLQLVFGAPEFSVLGDWLAQEISRALSRSNLLQVISHLSSRELSKRVVDINAVRKTLRADYCVTGSMRCLKGELIIDADFVETGSGHILWTRQFVASEFDFLGPASQGISEIVGAIGRAIVDDAISYVRARPLRDLDDHHLLVAGVDLMHRSTLAAFARSRELIEEAIRREPRGAEAHAWLGKWYILSVFNRWSTDVTKDTQLARDTAAQALEIDPKNAFCLTIDGFAQNNLFHRLDDASDRYDQALRYNPNEPLAWLLKGTLHAFRDQGTEAVACVSKACALSPIDPLAYYYNGVGATAHIANGNYSKALELSEQSIASNGRHISSYRAKIIALHFLDRGEEARATGAELMLRQPDVTVSGYLRQHPAADHKIGQDAAEAMRAAGIPEGEN